MRIETISHASELGSWRKSFGWYEPGSRYVNFLWDVEGVAHHARENILPTGNVELIFNLASTQYLIHPNEPTRTEYRKAWVSGMQQRNMITESDGYQHLIGVQLTALGAWRFLGLPMDELRDRVVDSDLLLGRAIRDLRAELLSRRRPEERLTRLGEYVLSRIDEGPEVHQGISHAWNHVLSGGGAVPVSALADLAGYSYRQLLRKFDEQVGLGPKRFCEILRLQTAAKQLMQDREIDLADVALSSGYYDQAHFNRAFRKFSGVTPSDFIAGVLPDGPFAIMFVD
ncbi:MAG: helix-turn-helix domain-containing protein [Thermoanaerobaculia bacterium]|nr:helix-turn-helix domain-containing protein [Thermoanaerobaculia bacterium]